MDTQQQEPAKDSGDGCAMVMLGTIAVVAGVLYFGFGVDVGSLALEVGKAIGALFVILCMVALVVGPFIRMNDPDVHRGQVPGWQWQEWHENGGGPFGPKGPS